jgi:hypothetical protein
MEKATRRLMVGWVLILAMGLAAGIAGAIPNPQQAKYGIAIRNNDPEVFEEVPFGQPVVYAVAQWCFPASDTVWGVAVHGTVNLPNPPGAGWTWRVRCVSFYDAADQEEAAAFWDGGGHGPNAWTAAVTGGEWCLWVAPEFGVFWGMWPGSYEVKMVLEIKGPGGDWVPVGNSVTAYITL